MFVDDDSNLLRSLRCNCIVQMRTDQRETAQSIKLASDDAHRHSVTREQLGNVEGTSAPCPSHRECGCDADV